MNELRTDGGAPVSGDWGNESVPADAIRDLFVVLGKALRAYQLYDANNPVRQRFVENLRSAVSDLWKETDRLTLAVEEHRLLVDDVAVYSSESRADSLAFLFYKDGIREITLRPGLEKEELERFLGVLQRARKLRPEGDDLLTVLWEEDLQHFQYQYIDYLAEGVSLPEPGSGNSAEEMQRVLEGELGEEEEEEAEAAAEGRAAPPPRKTVSQDDFNPTLHSLDPGEMQTLRRELQKEMQRDLRMDVLAALFDRLEEPHDRARQSEILDILGTLLPNFLSRGALVPATHVLRELGSLEGRDGIFDEERRARSRAVVQELSRPAFISELIQALYDGTIRSTPQQLADFLSFLHPAALAPLLRASETVEHKELAKVLRRATRGIAEQNRGAVIRLLEESDPVLAAGAARMAGELQIAEAGPSLAHLLAHPDPEVRLAAVDAAVSLRASTAAGALQSTLDDPDRDVRVAAARALGELAYGPASARLERIVSGKEIREADISEKIAVFEAYGRVAAEQAVPLLDKLLNGKGFLGKREPAEVRAAAALALGRIDASEAVRALKSAAREDDPVVRSAVNRAMRHEG